MVVSGDYFVLGEREGKLMGASVPYLKIDMGGGGGTFSLSLLR